MLTLQLCGAIAQLLSVRTSNADLPIIGRESRASNITPAEDDPAIDAEQEGEEDGEDEEDEGEDADEVRYFPGVSSATLVLLASLESAWPKLLLCLPLFFLRRVRGNSPTSCRKKRRKSLRARPWTSQCIE
jgi:hypothetical protein